MYTGQINILVEPEFEKRNASIVRFLNEACCLTNSRCAWKLLRHDERAQWDQWKVERTRGEDEQRKKDEVKSKLTTCFATHNKVGPKAKAGPNPKVRATKVLQNAK